MVTGPLTISMDHPRSRGEYPSGSCDGVPLVGSSPLSRGILIVVYVHDNSLGIIPALAGNTRYWSYSGFAKADHPRSRGEYSRRKWSPRPTYGSSPLSRGIQDWSGTVVKKIRIIPALAGNTECDWRCRVGGWDHPRSRGEYL